MVSPGLSKLTLSPLVLGYFHCPLPFKFAAIGLLALLVFQEADTGKPAVQMAEWWGPLWLPQQAASGASSEASQHGSGKLLGGGG